jgi:hypothetical protein
MACNYWYWSYLLGLLTKQWGKRSLMYRLELFADNCWLLGRYSSLANYRPRSFFFVTIELKHLSYWGVCFCLPVSKKSAACELSHILYCKTLRKLRRAIQNKMWNADIRCSAPPWLHFCIQLLALKHCCSISMGSCLTTLLTAQISIQATTTCFPTWRTGCDHSTSAMSWWRY